MMFQGDPNITLLTLDVKRLRACLPLDISRHVLPALQPPGSLAVLSNELLHHIFADVDIPTMTAFRRVNRTARAEVDNVLEYIRLVQFHPDVLCTVVASQACAYSCRELSAKLRATQNAGVVAERQRTSTSSLVACSAEAASPATGGQWVPVRANLVCQESEAALRAGVDDTPPEGAKRHLIGQSPEAFFSRPNLGYPLTEAQITSS